MKRIATSLTALGIAFGLAGCSGATCPTPSAAQSAATNSVASASTGISNRCADPNVPGATGYTIIPGNSSTISGDLAATMMQRTGQL